MTARPAFLDVVGRVTPLGVRFWDEVTRNTIGDGLSVSAYRAGRPERRYALGLNHANTFTLQNVWPEAEFGLGDEAYWAALPPPRSWVIEVADQAGRFVPFSFEAAVPHQGLFQWPGGSPLEPSPGVPLFSSPTRPLGSGCGVIRADLGDVTQFDARAQEYAPAAGAVIEAWYDGARLGRGLADEHGRILIVWPYPEPVNPPLTSPLGPRRALTAQSWSIELRAFYQPVTPAPARPDLYAALSQAPATLYQLLSPATGLTQASVDFGIEAVLKTTGQNVLLIGP